MFTAARKREETAAAVDQADDAPALSAADRQRARAAARSRKLAAAAGEIGKPPARNEELWQRYRYDLFAYLTERFPHTTGRKPFSPEHKRIIYRQQDAILHGGQELIIVYRGFAKSTITENAATWAAGYGHRLFFVLIGADHSAAKQALDSIQCEFETNDLLMEIFPEVCHAARALEGVAQRAGKQTIDGKLTHIEWSKARCVLPTVEGFDGSGAIIWPKGITANLRGMRFKRPDGVQARPDFVMLDDPQTDESAASREQNNKRLGTLNNTILRMAGHDRTMAAVINATIIEPDDMVDQLSNPKNYPGWRTSKVPMLTSFADAHHSLWLGKYAEIRGAYDQEDDDARRQAAIAATDYYRTHRAEMDAGAAATWEHCFDESCELSAIQHAYNILIDTTEDAFNAECQNKPARASGGLVMLSAEQYCGKMSGYVRDAFPAEAELLTAFVDVHPSILYYKVYAWEPSSTGFQIRYGTFPDQGRKYFSHNSLAVRLQDLFPGLDMDATVTAGLAALLLGNESLGELGLMRREFIRSDGVPKRIERGLIDANGEASDAVKKFIRQSDYAAILLPSYGKGITAKQKPISQWHQSRGRKDVGPEWTYIKAAAGDPKGVIFDANYWKARVHRAYALPDGSRGAAYIYKADKPNDHRLVADHFKSEKATRVVVGSREVDEFGSPRAGTDNHYWDCDVGNFVAASTAGIRSVAGGPAKRQSLSLAELQAQKRAR